MNINLRNALSGLLLLNAGDDSNSDSEGMRTNLTNNDSEGVRTNPTNNDSEGVRTNPTNNDSDATATSGRNSLITDDRMDATPTSSDLGSTNLTNNDSDATPISDHNILSPISNDRMNGTPSPPVPWRLKGSIRREGTGAPASDRVRRDP